MILFKKSYYDLIDFQCCVCSLYFAKKIVLVLHLRTVHFMDPVTAKALVDEQLDEQVETLQNDTSEEMCDNGMEDIDWTEDNDRTQDNDWTPDIEDTEEDKPLRWTTKIENLKIEIEDIEIPDSVVFESEEEFLPIKASPRKKKKRKSGSDDTLTCKVCHVPFEDIPKLIEHVWVRAFVIHQQHYLSECYQGLMYRSELGLGETHFISNHNLLSLLILADNSSISETQVEWI